MKCRLQPQAARKPISLRHTTAIAASKAQNDGGVFDFNFRDERYMPFEGGGAVSTWQLSLPKTFRPFDYGTISDVVLRISYTAEADETLRGKIDDALDGAAEAVGKRLQSDGLPLLLSLRRDLPDAWRKLVTAPVGTDVEVTIEERHLPLLLTGWLGGRALRGTNKKPQISFATTSILADATAKPADANFGLSARGSSGTTSTLSFGNRGADGLFSASFARIVTVDPTATTTDVKLVFKITAAGSFAPPANPPSIATVDEAKLRDVMILATLKIATN